MKNKRAMHWLVASFASCVGTFLSFSAQAESLTRTGAMWGNIGNQYNAGIAESSTKFNNSNYTTLTLDFGSQQNMSQTEIGNAGTVKITSIVFLKRNNSAPTMPTTVTATQEGGKSVTGTITEGTTARKVYLSTYDYRQASNQYSTKTVEQTITFADDDATFDTTKPIVLTFPSNFGALVIDKPNEVLGANATWCPLVEVIGDYSYEPPSSISINFGNQGSVSGTYGVVPSTSWFNVTATGNTREDVPVYGSTEQAKVVWSCKNLYQYTSGVTDTALKGYLDDGNEISIEVSNIPFAYYDVIIYQATDSGSNYAFNPPSVNGTYYSYDGARTSATRNDTTLKYGQAFGATATTGRNYVYLKNCFSGTCTIKGGGNANTARGCIAAIQIVEHKVNIYTATVTTDTSFSKLTWSPAKPTTGFETDAILQIENTASAALTFDEDLTVARVAFINAADTPVALTFDETKTISAIWDFSSAEGGLSAANMDGEALAKNAVAGVPYTHWLVSGSVIGTPKVTCPAAPNEFYTITAETLESYGVRLIVTAADVAQFSAVSINVRGGTSETLADASSFGLYPVLGSAWGYQNDATAVTKDDVTFTPYISSGTFGTENNNSSITDNTNGKYIFRGNTKDYNDSTTIGYTITGLKTKFPGDKKYRVIVYFGTDTANIYFAPVTINDVTYCGPSTGTTGGCTIKGSTAMKWGHTGANHDSNAAAEGVNAVISDVLDDDEVTIRAIRSYSTYSTRASMSAIQVVEVGTLYQQISYTATVNANTDWDAISWTPSKPAEGFPNNAVLTITATDTPTITFTAAETLSSVPLTINGAVKLAAADALYENGCWEKTIATFNAFTATEASFDALKEGFHGTYTQTATGFTLRAQNKEVISINIAGGSGGGTGADSPTENIVSGTDYYGLAPTVGDSWNNINRQWQSGGNQTISIEGPKAYDGATTVTRETMSLSATGKNTWQASISNPFLRGYLDDGNGVTVEVHGVPYTKYDVIVYATSDSATQLNPITINGTEYTYANGATTPGSTVWGVGLYNTPEVGKNALRINDCTGEQLTITSKRVVGRGTLCAVQVINQGDIVVKSTYVADVTATTAWSDGKGAGLTSYGQTWVNGQLSTLTLTNTAAAATLTFDTATTGQIFKVVSAADKVLTLPATSLRDTMAFSFLDFTEAVGGVVIDISGLAAAEAQVISSIVTGYDNVSFTGTVDGFGGYVDKDGIRLCPKVDVTRKNPVTGADIANTYVFLGTTDGDWEVLDNWRKSVNGLLVPYADSTYAPGMKGGDNNIGPELFDGNLISYEADAEGYKNVVADGNPMVDGYKAQYCLVNGVRVSIGSLYGITSDGAELNYVVDATSKMIVKAGPSTNYGVARTLNASVAAHEGLVFEKYYSVASSVNYYLAGVGSVDYAEGVTNSTHTIKQCSVALGTGADKVVCKQPLVTFSVSYVTFTWNDIVIDKDDNTVTLTPSATPPTIADDVGTYCIHQETDGVYITYIKRAPAWEATVSAAGSYTLSSLDWNTKPFAPKAGDLITITVTDDVTEMVTFEFDDVAITADTFRVTAAVPDVKLKATEKPAHISNWQINGEGYLIYGWPVDALASSTDKVAYSGGSTAGTAIGIDHRGGLLRLWGNDGAWTLEQTCNSTATTVEMKDCSVTYTNVFGIGMASYNLVQHVSVTTPSLVLSQGNVSRTASLVIDGNSSVTVTGSKIEDSNKNSVMVGHWDGPSTLTVAGGSELSAVDTIILVGKTGNTQAINLDGGLITTKGIVASASASGSNTLVLGGGTLALGEQGISSYSSATKIQVNVTNDVTIQANADLSITQPLTIAADATLRLTATSGNMILNGEIVNNGTIRVVGGDVTLVDPKTLGTVTHEGVGKNYYGHIATINDGGKFKIPTDWTYDQIKIYDASGTEMTVTSHDETYVYFDWSITDKACWWDYEFDGTLTSSGTDTTSLNAEGTEPYYNDANDALWVGHATPYRGASYPKEFTAVLYGTVVSNNTHIMLGFGSTTGAGSGADNPYAIALACGDPAKNEVKLLFSTGANAQELVTMTVPYAYTANHLYVFSCETITDAGTDKTQIKIYLDGHILQTYTHTGVIVLGGGFQIGSVHGGVPSGYVKATTANESAYLDFLRVYNQVLTEETIQQYAVRYPYHSQSGKAERTFTGDANWVATEAWQQTAADATVTQQDAPNADTEVVVKATAASEVTLNLTTAANYESLTVQAGSAMTLRKGGTGTVVPTVVGVTTVGAPLTVDYDAITFGNVEVLAGQTLTFDFASLDLEEEWESRTIVLTKSVTLGAGASIASANLDVPVGRTAELVQNPSTGYYELHIGVAGVPMAVLTGSMAFGDLEWKIGEEKIVLDWTKKVIGTLTNTTEGATLTFGNNIVSDGAAITFVGDKSLTLATAADISVTGLVYDFTSLDAQATFAFNPMPATVKPGQVRYAVDMGEQEYGGVWNTEGGTCEFKKVTLVGPGSAARQLRIPTGDEVTMKNTIADLHASTSVDVCGGTLYLGAEDNAAIWYGATDTTFTMSAGTTIVRANGQGQSGSGNGFLLGFGGALSAFDITGGLLDVSGSSINFWSATTTNNITGGTVRAKGIFAGNKSGVIALSDAGVLEIGALGVAKGSCEIVLNGGTLRGYETGATVSSTLAVTGDTALEANADASLALAGGATGDGTLTVAAGTVSLGAENGLSAVPVSVANGATFDLNGFGCTNVLTVTGTGVDGRGVLVNRGGDEVAFRGTLLAMSDIVVGGTSTISFMQRLSIDMQGHALTLDGDTGFIFELGGGTISNGTAVVVTSGTLASNGATALGKEGKETDLSIGAQGVLDLSGGTSLSCRNFTSRGTITGSQAALIVNGTFDATHATSVGKLTLRDGATLSGTELTVTSNLAFGGALTLSVTDLATLIRVATVPVGTDLTKCTALTVNGQTDYQLLQSDTTLYAKKGGGCIATISLDTAAPWTNFESLKVTGRVTGFVGSGTGTTNVNVVVTAGDGTSFTQTFAYVGADYDYAVTGLEPGRAYQVYAFVSVGDDECGVSKSTTVFSAHDVGAWIDEHGLAWTGDAYVYYPTNTTQTIRNSEIRDITVKQTCTVGASVVVGGHAGLRFALDGASVCRLEVMTNDVWCAVPGAVFAPTIGATYAIRMRLDGVRDTVTYTLINDEGVATVTLATGTCAAIDWSNPDTAIVFTGTTTVEALQGVCHDVNLIAYGAKEYPDLDAAIAAEGADAVFVPVWRTDYRLHDDAGTFFYEDNGLFSITKDKWYHVLETRTGTTVEYRYRASNNWIAYADAAGVLSDGQGGWRVTSEVGLAYLAEQATNGWLVGNVTLESDLDLSSKNWTPIHQFTGVFDGQGHMIAGLNNTNVVDDVVLGDAGYYTAAPQNDWGYAAYGLFGTATNAVFNDVVLKDVAISNTASSVAALLGVHAGGDLEISGVTNVCGFVRGVGEGRTVAGLATIGGDAEIINTVAVVDNFNGAEIVGTVADARGGNVAQILAGTTRDTLFDGTVTISDNVGVGVMAVSVITDAGVKTWATSDYGWLPLPVCNCAASIIYTDDEFCFWTCIDANEAGEKPIDPVDHVARMRAGYFSTGEPNQAGWWIDAMTESEDGEAFTLEGTGATLDAWETVVADRNVTIDLNQNCIYGLYDCDVFVVAAGCTLTLKNGVIYYAHGYEPTSGEGTVVLENVTVAEIPGDDFYARTVPLQGLAVTAGKVSVAVPFTSTGFYYIVDSTSDLSQDWQKQASQQGTGGAITFDVTAAGESGFYRVRISTKDE